ALARSRSGIAGPYHQHHAHVAFHALLDRGVSALAREAIDGMHLAGEGVPKFRHAIDAAARAQRGVAVQFVLDKEYVHLAEVAVRDEYVGPGRDEIAVDVVGDELRQRRRFG